MRLSPLPERARPRPFGRVSASVLLLNIALSPLPLRPAVSEERTGRAEPALAIELRWGAAVDLDLHVFTPAYRGTPDPKATAPGHHFAKATAADRRLEERQVESEGLQSFVERFELPAGTKPPSGTWRVYVELVGVPGELCERSAVSFNVSVTGVVRQNPRPFSFRELCTPTGDPKLRFVEVLSFKAP